MRTGPDRRPSGSASSGWSRYETLMDAELACGRAAELIPQLDALTAEHPTAGILPGPAHGRPLSQWAPRRRPRGPSRSTGRRWPRSSASSRPRPSQELERRILSHDPSLLLDQTAGRPLRGYRVGERLGTGRDGTVFAARLPGSNGSWRSGSSARRSRTIPSSSARSRRPPTAWPPCGTPPSSPCRTTGASRGRPTWSCVACTGAPSPTASLARPLTTTEVASLVTRVGGALTAAAAAGVVHGAVTADNVLFDESGEPCLADFAVVAPGRRFGDGRRARVRGDGPRLCRRGRRRRRRPPPSDHDQGASDAGRPGPGARRGAHVRPGGRSQRPVNPYKGLRAFDESRRRRLLRTAPS